MANPVEIQDDFGGIAASPPTPRAVQEVADDFGGVPVAAAEDAPPSPEAIDAQRDAQLRSIFDAGLQKAPDAHANVLEVARQTGLKPDLVESQLPLLRQAAESAAFDPRRFREENPGLVDLLLEQPAAAGVVMRDEQISGFTRLMRAAGRAGEALAAGDPGQALVRAPAGEGAQDILGIGGTAPPTRTVNEAAPLGQALTPEALFPPSRQVPTLVSPLAESTGLDRLSVFADSWKVNRQRQELSKLGARLLFQELHGDDTYPAEKRIVELEQLTGPQRFYDQGPLEQLGLDVIEVGSSQVETLKGGGAGGVAGAAVGGAVGLLARSPSAAASLAKFGWKAGAAAGAFVASFELESGSAYLEIRKLKTDDGRPVDPGIARGASILYGLTAAGVEVASLGPLLRTAGPLGDAIVKGEGRAFLKSMLADRTKAELFRGVAKAWARGVATEGTEEAVQETLQFVAEWGAKSATAGELQRFDWLELLGRDSEAFYKGSVGGFAMGAGGSAIHVTTESVRLAASARAGATVAAVAKLASSPSARAAPDLVAKMVEHESTASGEKVESVHVDAGAFTRLFQDQGADPNEAARQLLGVEGPARLRAAQAGAEGGRLEVPLAEYLEKWGSKGVAEALAADTTVRPGLMTPRELAANQEQIQAKAAELAKQYEAEHAPEPESTAEKRLVEVVQAQLKGTGVYKAGEAKHAVALTRAFLRTQAEAAGTSPDALFDDYVITVARKMDGQPAVAAAAQPTSWRANLSPETNASIDQAIGQGDPVAGEELAKTAYLDTLTPAGSKAAYKSFLSRPRKGVFVAIDLNKFKGINDTFGHDVGDQAITAAGTAFSAASRSAGGKLFRPGGDEFTAHFDTLEAARRFIADAQARFEQIGPVAADRRISFSAGLAGDPKSADVVSYRAKEIAHGAPDLLTTGRGYVAWDEAGIEEEPLHVAQRFEQESAGVKGALQAVARLFQGERGYVDIVREGLKKIFKVALTDKADLSTFLHESGHVFLDLMGDLAEAKTANPRLVQDWQATLDWLGVKDRASITRTQHEKWAKAFESYLAEGRAPSASLAGAFQRFKLWLRALYRQFPSDQLNDQIRSVFDRMLATDDELERMQTAMGTDRAVFRSPDDAGMTPAQFQAYLADREKAFSRGTRATYRHVINEQARVTEQWWKDETKKLEHGLRDEWERRPDARAWAYVKRGELVLEDGRKVNAREMGRLDRALVDRAFGRDPRLEKEFDGRIVKQNGEDPAEVAKLFGFKGARELLQALVELPGRDEWAQAEAERRMTERFPDVLADRTRLSDLAGRALNEETSDWLLRETEALRARATEDGGRVPVESIREAARQIAEAKKVRGLSPGRALQAERSAADRAIRAAAQGDYRLAYVEQQARLLNHYLYRELSIAKGDRDGFEELAGKMGERRRREVLGKGGKVFLNAADSILEVLGFKEPAPAEEVDARQTLPEWTKALEEAGIVPGFAAARISEVITDPPESWKDLSVADVRMLGSALAQLYTAARDMNTVVHLGKRVMMDILAGEIAGEASRLPKKAPRPASSTAAPTGYWAKQRVAGILSGLTDPEQLIGDLGPAARKFFWGRYLEQRTVEDDLTRVVSRFFAERWDALPEKLQDRRYERDLKGLDLVPLPEDLGLDGEARDRQWAWMVALNMGNRSNIDRLLGGYGWNEDAARAFLDQNLTPEEWTFIESVWELLDKEFYPKVAAAYEQVNGIRPPKIEALPFALGSGRVVRGGYFPARYDPVASRVGADQSVDALTKLYGQRAGAFSVAKSFTKERVKEYSDVISLEWSLVPSHVANVIHYVAFDQYIRDAARMINHPEVQRTIDQRLGLKARPQLESWLRAVATAQNDAIPEQLGDMYAAFTAARSRFVMNTLGYSLTVAAGDFTNPLVAIASGHVKARYLAPALLQIFGPGAAGFALGGVPGLVVGSAAGRFGYAPMRRRALQASPELRNRAENMRMRLQLQLGELGRAGKRGVVGGLLEKSRETAWIFMEWTDRITSTIIWDGAYRQAAAKGLTEADAVAEADAAVRSMLPSHNIAEQPAFLRDRRGMGGLVAFYGYFSKLYNVQRAIFHEPTVEWQNADDLGGKVKVLPGVAHAAGRALAVFFVANVLADFLMGRGPEDDEEWPEWLTRKMLAAPWGMVPIFGVGLEEATNRLTSYLWQGEAKHRQFSVRASPAAAGLERLVLAIMKIADEEKDNDDRLWALLEFFGLVFKTPVGSRQVGRTGRYVTSGGAADDASAGDAKQVGSGLVYGERDRQPMNPFTAEENP